MADGMIEVKPNSASPFSKTEAKLKAWQGVGVFASLDKYGREGAVALAAATPVDDGSTANAWTYTVKRSGQIYEIAWRNTEMAGGTPVVILLQYGHGTGTGGYVQGRDFINPVIIPLFERIKADVLKAVKSA